MDLIALIHRKEAFCLTSRELRLSILEWLSKFLSPYGFRGVKSRFQVEREISGGLQWVKVVHWDYQPLMYTYALCFCVRIEKVEEIYSRFSPVNPKHDEATATTRFLFMDLFNGLTRDFPGLNRTIEVRNEEELQASFRKLGALLDEKVVPFWEPQTTISAIEESFRDTSLYPVRLGDGYNAYMRWLILAAFMGKEIFEEVARLREERSRSWPTERKERCNQLITFLSIEVLQPP